MTEPYASALARAKTLMEEKYGVPVRPVHFPEGFSGDLDGAEIYINQDKSAEEQLFNLLHLFGHTIQWAVREDGYELGYKLFHLPDPNLLTRLVDYEHEAARYSASLLLEIGAGDLLPWLSAYSDCDIHFLEHLYRTGEQRPFDSFRRNDTPIIEPLAIPAFMPVRRNRRTSGIVVSSPRP